MGDDDVNGHSGERINLLVDQFVCMGEIHGSVTLVSHAQSICKQTVTAATLNLPSPLLPHVIRCSLAATVHVH